MHPGFSPWAYLKNIHQYHLPLLWLLFYPFAKINSRVHVIREIVVQAQITFMWVRDRGEVRDRQTEEVKEGKKEWAGVTVNSGMIDERLTWLSSRLPASISMTGQPPARRRQTTRQWRKMRILSPISFSHRCWPTLPRLLVWDGCVCVCAHVCFCAGKLTKCVSHFPDGLAYGRTLAQGCSLQKSLTQLETHAENAQGLEHLYVTCVYTGECVWVCVGAHATECFKGHLSLPQI